MSIAALQAGLGLSDQEFIDSLDDSIPEYARIQQIVESWVNPEEQECIHGKELEELGKQQDKNLKLCEELETLSEQIDDWQTRVTSTLEEMQVLEALSLERGEALDKDRPEFGRVFDLSDEISNNIYESPNGEK